jgi:hypothetical protein
MTASSASASTKPSDAAAELSFGPIAVPLP